MKIAAIIQARMGSARLPGKVLKKVLDTTLLEYQIERVKKSKYIDQIIVATTVNAGDAPIAALCEYLNVSYYRGSEKDVLGRYYEAAVFFEADAIVRLTADCPLLDPEIVDKVVKEYVNHSEAYDYVSNGLTQSYPIGMDTEIFSFSVLQEAYLKARQAYEREHVTAYLYDEKNNYRLKNVCSEKDYSQYRLTVDTNEDFNVIETLLNILVHEKGIHFKLQDIIEVLKRKPEISKINSGIQQKSLFDI